MHVISIGNLKGGVGKSNLIFNLSGLVSEFKKILLIDVDPQSNLSYNCGIRIEDADIFSSKDIFELNKPPRPEEIIIKNPIKELPNLDIIPASIFLFETEENLFIRADRERILKRYLEDNEEFLKQYDYILIDTNPSMSIININAFFAADDIILICDVSANSFKGAELFCYLWDKKREQLRKEDNIGAIVINNFSGSSNLAKDMLEFTKQTEFSRDIVMNSVINQTVKLKETEITHKPINILDRKHKAYQQYEALVLELAERRIL